MKEKSERDIIRDLFVKLKPIFKSDIYIVKHKYVISGPTSNTEVAGDYLCILEEKYIDALKIFYPEEKVIYVKNLVLIKDELDSHYEYINDEEKSLSLEDLISNYLNHVDEVSGWKNLIETYPGIQKVIYDKKHVYGIKVNNGKEVINIGKSLFPVLTEKNMAKSDCVIEYIEEKELYELMIRFHHTHFQIYMKYYAIPMELLDGK